jgi:hypothetical protein
MLIRRSGYPARFGNKNNSKGSQGSQSAQREGVHRFVAAQTGNQRVQEAFLSLKKTLEQT